MEDITLIMGSVFPVPAVKGGAVENLIENIVKAHEKEKKVNLSIICAYDFNAEKIAKEKFKNTNFNYIKVGKINKFIDQCISFVATKIFHKKNVMAYSYIFQRLGYYRKISNLLHKKDFGKIILENSTGLYLTLKWKKNYLKYAGRYYYHCHNKVNMDFGCIDIIEKTNKFISVSDYMGKDLQNFSDRIKNKKFLTLKNIIDYEKFEKNITETEKNILKNKYHIDSNEKVIIFVGRLTEEKGIKQLLMAINDVTYKNFKLLIVGSYFFNTKVKSDFEKELDELVNKNKERIIFTGYINYNEIYQLYKISDFAVLPSMWDEPAGLTIQEAEACGLPVITTNSGGIPEYVINGSSIIIKKDENIVENLKTEIENLLDDEKKLKEMSNKSLEIIDDLDICKYYNNLIKIVEE